MYEKKNLLKKCNKTEILLTLVQTKQLLLWVLKVFKALDKFKRKV